MEPQPNAQEDLTSSVARLKDLLEKVSTNITTRTFPTLSRNADTSSRNAAEVDQEEDQVLGGAAVQAVDVTQDVHGIEAEDWPHPAFDSGARRKGLRMPAPETYNAWQESFLHYAVLHVCLGCLTGQLRIE